jgi:hypothetical protein
MIKIARGFTSVMAQRREPPDALDYFPTPLWATRALFRHVLPFLGIEAIGSVWEPSAEAPLFSPRPSAVDDDTVERSDGA